MERSCDVTSGTIIHVTERNEKQSHRKHMNTNLQIQVLGPDLLNAQKFAPLNASLCSRTILRFSGT